MSKEITLEQLAASSKGNDVRPQNVTPVQQEQRTGPVRMTPAQVAETLTKAGVMQEKKEKIVEAPLVENAFNSMNRTLQERRDWIQHTMMPIVEENAREMALEAEVGENALKPDEAEVMAAASAGSGIDVEFEDDKMTDEDDIDSLLASLDDNTSDGPAQDAATNAKAAEVTKKRYSVENVDTPVVEEKASKPVEKKATKAEEPADEESGSFDELMKDLDKEDALNVVDDEDETPEEIREKFKKTLNEVKITSDPIDFNKFKIRKHPVNSNLVLNAIKNSRVVKKADWAMFHSKRSITFLECSGPELDTLRKNIANANGINGVISSLRFIYDHIEDANKPSFEQWTKLIRTEDIESLYYGIYRACYSGSNLIARVCTSDTCKKTSLIDTKIDDMVVFGQEKDTDGQKAAIKKEFKDIMNNDTTTENTVFESTLMQISDNIVISYSPATLYSTFIQFATLRSEITDKYGELLNTLAYIDGFFQIDRATSELIPIEIKEYPGNLNKTVLTRLKVFAEILKSLSNDQYNVMIAKLNNIIQTPKITYIYPETTCPECGAKIEQEPVDSMLNLLFTRAQLAQIKSL